MIKIVSCFWNVENYIEKCLKSVMSQNLNNFKMYLIDDVSTDTTVDKINSLIEGDNRFILIQNSEKKFKLKNLDDLLMNENLFDDEDIIIELDGDDWLENDNVLSLINGKYNNNKNLWITNGSFVYSDGRFGFSSKVNTDTVRTDTFLFSHLRTWKVHLWRNIEQKSFLDENGEYFKSAGDAAYSFPMVEMAGEKHYEYIPNILYVYNEQNPYNDHKSGSSSGSAYEQLRCSNIIRNLPKYQKL
jgi:glycosyltransferase involved in cell wall biosynthesis